MLTRPRAFVKLRFCICAAVASPMCEPVNLSLLHIRSDERLDERSHTLDADEPSVRAVTPSLRTILSRRLRGRAPPRASSLNERICDAVSMQITRYTRTASASESASDALTCCLCVCARVPSVHRPTARAAARRRPSSAAWPNRRTRCPPQRARTAPPALLPPWLARPTAHRAQRPPRASADARLIGTCCTPIAACVSGPSAPITDLAALTCYRAAACLRTAIPVCDAPFAAITTSKTAPLVTSVIRNATPRTTPCPPIAASRTSRPTRRRSELPATSCRTTRLWPGRKPMASAQKPTITPSSCRATLLQMARKSHALLPAALRPRVRVSHAATSCSSHV